MAKYNFTQEVVTPWKYKVLVDPASNYGYWEWPDGTEGGGLWFGAADEPGKLELQDYDGHFILPGDIAPELRKLGYVVDDGFNSESWNKEQAKNATR